MYYAGVQLKHPNAGYSIAEMERAFAEIDKLEGTIREVQKHARRPRCRVCGKSVLGRSYVHNYDGCVHTHCRDGYYATHLFECQRSNGNGKRN